MNSSNNTAATSAAASRKQEEKKNFGPTIDAHLRQFAPLQAARFRKLTGVPSEIATEGIIRHLSASARHEVSPDFRAVREVIDDALNGKRVYAEVAP